MEKPPSSAQSSSVPVNLVVGGPVPDLAKKAAAEEWVRSPGIELHPVFQKILLDASINRASEVLMALAADEFRFRERIRGTLVQADRHLILSQHEISSLVEWLKQRGATQTKELVKCTEWNFSFSVKNDVYQASLVLSVMGQFTHITIRMSPRKETIFSPTSWGMDPAQTRLFSEFLAKRQGLVLFCGSDQHNIADVFVATVNMFASPSKHVIAIEETPLPWAFGVDALTASGSSSNFADLLQVSFKHNPDVLALSPLVNKESIVVCLREAMKGRFILGHTYANDTVDAIIQLLAQDIELYLLVAGLIGVLAKKTVRLNCQQCQIKDPASRTLAKELGVPLAMQPAWFYKGKGCESCSQSGVSGETDIFEVLPMGEDIRFVLKSDLKSETLKNVLKSKGLLSFRQIALHKAINGQISLDEVIRVSSR